MVRRLARLFIFIYDSSERKNLIKSTNRCIFGGIYRDAVVFQDLTSNIQVLCGVFPALNPVDQGRDEKFPEFFKRIHDRF